MVSADVVYNGERMLVYKITIHASWKSYWNSITSMMTVETWNSDEQKKCSTPWKNIELEPLCCWYAFYVESYNCRMDFALWIVPTAFMRISILNCLVRINFIVLFYFILFCLHSRSVFEMFLQIYVSSDI